MMLLFQHGRQRKRRGITLVVVVAAMGIAAGLLSVLLSRNVDMYRRLQADRARCTVRAVSSSAAAYAERHRDELSRMERDESETLDLAELAGDGMEVRAVIKRVGWDDGDALQMTARVERGRIVMEEVRDLAVKPSP